MKAPRGDRRGRVFHERYHEHILTTPFEVHRGYVLRNHSKHSAEWGRPIVGQVDEYSSGSCFDGWRTPPKRIETACAQGPPPVTKATTWLLTTGWRRHGPIDL